MINLKTYILEGSLLDDIDDILADGDVKVPHIEENGQYLKRKIRMVSL